MHQSQWNTGLKLHCTVGFKYHPTLMLRLELPQDIQITRFRITSVHSLPLYLGIQRTVGGRPLMLKCFPSNVEHCSSRKSFCPRGHGSVLQERNFILRPTQNLPPFLGLVGETRETTEMDHRRAGLDFSVCPHLTRALRLQSYIVYFGIHTKETGFLRNQVETQWIWHTGLLLT